MSRVPTEGAETTGDDDNDERRPRLPDESPDNADETRASEGHTDTMIESDAGEDLQTESADDEHVPRNAQCEMEHQGEGASGPDDETRHSKVAAGDPKALREGVKGAGDDDDGRHPGDPHEPSDNSPDAARSPAHVLVDPGGGTGDNQNKSVPLESADAGLDGEVIWMCRDAQDEGKNAETPPTTSIKEEKANALALGRSTTRAAENSQHMRTSVDDVPEMLPEHPTNLRSERTNPRASSSRERRSGPRFDETLTGDGMGASGPSDGDEDPRDRPKNLPDTLERVRRRLEPRIEENSPRELQTSWTIRETKQTYQAMSTAPETMGDGRHNESTRVKTEALTACQANQHEQRRDTTSDVPGPSIPPPNHHIRHCAHPNPPRRRGRPKSRPTRVSHSKRTYQVT